MSYPIQKHYDLFVGNEWHASSSNRTMDCVSPITGEVLCTVPDASERDVVEAVIVAKAAWPAWSRAGSRKRSAAMLKLADRLVQDADRFAWLETSDTGKPWRESHANVMTAADRLRYYAGVCRALEASTFSPGGDIMSYDIREPLGVIGIIGAWNFPINMFLGKIAPAIATGNAVIYKPAEPTPLTTLEMCKLIAECLPPGIVNVLTGYGATAGAAIVSHPDIRKISVTGSVETGKAVMAAAAPSTKQLTLELGGKNAQIVFDDADLDRAAQGIMLGAFMNQGQVCTAGSRVLVHHSVAKELQRKVVDLIPQLKIGDPFDKATTMGTMVYEDHLNEVLRYIEIGKGEGAKLIAGGGRLTVKDYPKALFMQPTVFADAEPDMVVASQEIFGPVLTFQTWSDEYAMMQTANLLDYGLAAGIWTENLGRAHRTARDIQAGRVWINCYNLFPSGAAFGGTKASGYGREDAFETMYAFTQVKNVVADLSEKPRRFYQ